MKNKEPIIPYLIRKWKNRSIQKKKKEIEELKLEIEKTKLEKELKGAKGQ
jgi:hypothetical protein